MGTHVLENEFLKVKLCDYGARVMSIIVKDKNIDVIAGYDTEEEYKNENDTYFGAIVGRVGNRICDGKFTLNGINYQLATNNGKNHLHGGNIGFDRKTWKAKEKENKVIFSYIAKDEEENYPGKLNVKVTYELKKNSLNISYKAISNKDTLCNLTNHSYFNLDGKGTILNHYLKINASTYTPVDYSLIPLGYKEDVTNTPFDFTKAKKIKKSLDFKNEQIKFGNGIDHNFCLNEEGKIKAILESKESKIKMLIYTTEPGLQIYTGNYIDIKKGKNNLPYINNSCIAMETQHYPDAINQKDFPSIILKQGEVYKTKTTYKFVSK